MAKDTKLRIEGFFDDASHTVSYLVWDGASMAGAIVDPVLDFDQAAGRAHLASARRILAAAEQNGVDVQWVLETHIHADHLTSSRYIKAMTGAKIGIGEHIRDVQKIFRPVFNLEDVSADGSEFDRLFADGERFAIGGLDVEVMHTPGHTPACISYRIGDAVFVGDTLFMPDFGTARADFPGGDAHALYRSIRKLLALPPETRLFLCHDYKPGGRDVFAWETTVGDELQHNIHVHEGVTEDDFVKMRTDRDATLSAPELLLPAIQINIRAGDLPAAEENGVRYLKIPLKFDNEFPADAGRG